MTESERTARAALSRLFEPQDAAGLALVRIAGAEDALRIATGQLVPGAELEQELFRLLDENGSGGGWTGLGTARKRWTPRVPDLAPDLHRASTTTVTAASAALSLLRCRKRYRVGAEPGGTSARTAPWLATARRSSSLPEG